MVGAVALFVYCERAPQERLRLGVSSFGSEQPSELVHEACGRFGYIGGVCMFRYDPSMRCKRISLRPIADVIGIEGKGSIDAAQGLYQTAMAVFFGQAPPRHILHEAMNSKLRLVRVPSH